MVKVAEGDWNIPLYREAGATQQKPLSDAEIMSVWGTHLSLVMCEAMLPNESVRRFAAPSKRLRNNRREEMTNSIDTEVAQVASEISIKIKNLCNFDGESLKGEMTSLKKALLENQQPVLSFIQKIWRSNS